MNDNNRKFLERNAEFDYLSMEELKKRVENAEALLMQLEEEEHQLQQEVKTSKTRVTLRVQDDPYLKYAQAKAEETSILIKENAEKEIKLMAEEVKQMKARYDREMGSLQERIDTKKHYIVTMLESMVVLLDEEDGGTDQMKKPKSTGVEAEIQKLLEKLA